MDKKLETPNNISDEPPNHSILDSIARSTVPAIGEVPVVAVCEDHEHPTLGGRVLVRVVGAATSQWVPTVQSLTVRRGDQVLLVKPGNWMEPLIVGVIDGYDARPTRPAVAVGELRLDSDQAILVTSREGAPIAELSACATGPVVRLLGDDVTVDIAGELRVSAKALKLAARQGEVTISATGDVCVRGETIALN